MMMIDIAKRIWRARDLRNSILFVLVMFFIFRLIAHIPIPGIDTSALREFFQSNQVMGLLNVFSGGTIENFSIVAMGVAPYITASIIFQLLGMIVPRIEEIQKEGEYGRKKINQWSRMLTVPLALLQGYGMLAIFEQSGLLKGTHSSILGSPLTLSLTLASITAGTVFLMWIGELISEKKVGNGISLLIFAGIISGMPAMVQRTLLTYDRSALFTMILFVLVLLVTIVGVVVVNEAQRNIPIAYARQSHGMGLVNNVSNHLPLRLNMAGVIPIIFAISIMIFPPMIARFFVYAKSVAVVDAANWVIMIFNNQLFHGIAYFLLVFGFTFFYTSIIFQPEKVAENLQKQGAFIPGIRPGKPTVEYLARVTSRILLASGLFLATIAVLPQVMQSATNSTLAVVGGTSFLIVVSVVVETVKQIQSQMTTQDYDYYR
ncbi:MAG: preprotein translocase subunit SecY [bacterium]